MHKSFRKFQVTTPESFIDEEIDETPSTSHSEFIIPEDSAASNPEDDLSLSKIIKTEKPCSSSVLTTSEKLALSNVTKTYGKKSGQFLSNNQMTFPTISIPKTEVGIPNLEIVKQEVQPEDFIEEEY